jgi:hypothetical protein
MFPNRLTEGPKNNNITASNRPSINNKYSLHNSVPFLMHFQGRPTNRRDLQNYLHLLRALGSTSTGRRHRRVRLRRVYSRSTWSRQTTFSTKIALSWGSCSEWGSSSGHSSSSGHCWRRRISSFAGLRPMRVFARPRPPVAYSCTVQNCMNTTSQPTSAGSARTSLRK